MQINFEKIENWLKDNLNLTIFIIISFGIIIRLLYFFITKDQALWWDEAEYILMAKYFATGELFSDFLASRPLLLSLIWAFFMKLSLGEITFRLFELIISSLALIFIYLITKEISNKETAIVSTLLLSTFYLHIFYTSRLLLDSITPTLWLISIYFFINGYLIKKNNKKFYLASFFGAIGVFFYNQTIALFIIYLTFLLIIEKTKIFLDKRFYIFGFVALVTFLPNFILNQVLYKNPAEFIKTGISVGDVLTADYSGNLLTYIKYFPNYLGEILLVLFIISLIIVFYDLILGMDIVVKKPDVELKKKLFLLIWLVISFLVIIKIVGHFEDRYIMPIFPAIFIIIGLGLYNIKNIFSRYTGKYLLYLIIILLLIGVSFYQLKQADLIIKEKNKSFLQQKEAGLWIKENSNPQNTILTSFTPVLPYYSKRKIISFPGTEDELKKLIEDKKPKYMLISAFTGNPPYINNLNIQNYPILKLAKVYNLNNQPILIIFEIQYNQ